MKLEDEIIKRLDDAGFEVYLVGGAVRDMLRDVPPKDYDFATNAKPEEVQEIFSDKKLAVVGKRFKVTIVEGVEVATYRKDNQTKLFSAKYCEPVYANTIQEDLARRDLTINAMAINAVTDEFVDIYGGEEDLRNGIIKFVGTPINRIQQDPNRIVRACRFLAELKGSFDIETLRVLIECSTYVKNHVEPNVIRKEIIKALGTEEPSIFFSALHLIGALKYIFPAMELCFGHTGGEHHPETIGEHLMMAGDNISAKFPLVRLAGYLHDIGKPSAYQQGLDSEEYADGSFINHEHIGIKLTEKYLKKLRFSNDEISTVKELVGAHMRTVLQLSPRGIRRLKKFLADRGIDPADYIRLKLADRLANLNNTSFTKISLVRGMIINSGIRHQEEELPLCLADLAVTGGELIVKFGLKPGPVVGVLHRMLLDFVVEEGEEFNTYPRLVNQADAYLKEL
jgi:tRNA nucleotidyltransferase (CCA-adding enzyme)